MPDPTSQPGHEPARKSMLDRSLARIERAGNALPDPVTLFLILIAALLLGSALASAFGLAVIAPGTGETVAIVNLLSGPVIQRLFVDMPQTFASFPPLGTVVVAMIGVGLAERSGLFAAALGGFMHKVPARLLSVSLVFAGVMSSLAVDAGYVVLIPLGAVLFATAGRHPLAGLAATFAGVSAGFSANLIITPLDAILAGISQAGAGIVDSAYQVPITGNYYIVVALVPLFCLLGAWLTDKVIEPRLGQWSGGDSLGREAQDISASERRALRNAALAMGALVLGTLALTLPEGAPLRGADGGLDPFYKALVGLLSMIFAVGGIVYGAGVGTVRSDRDAVKLTGDALSDLGLYLLLAFVVAHFIALFSWSNIGIAIAVGGAAGLQAIGLTGVPLIISLVLMVGLMNLLLGSASAKWALLAPIFVPMFMLLGYTPEFTQAAYRMGDAFTNIITPLMPYFPLIIVFGRKYADDFGIGSLVALMLPYSIAFGLGSLALLGLWMGFDWPIGPGSVIFSDVWASP